MSAGQPLAILMHIREARASGLWAKGSAHPLSTGASCFVEQENVLVFHINACIYKMLGAYGSNSTQE